MLNDRSGGEHPAAGGQYQAVQVRNRSAHSGHSVGGGKLQFQRTLWCVMESPPEKALAYVRSLTALAERLARQNIVVRRLHCDWAAFGSWTVEASSGDGEARRSSAIQRRAFSEPGADVFRVIWDGKDRQLDMASTPTTVISMLNQWRGIEARSCDSCEAAIVLAYEWLTDRLASSPHNLV